MRRLRANGASLRDLEGEFGVSHSAIRYHTNDVPEPSGGWGKGGRSRSFDHEKAAKLKKQGLTLQQIATRFGVTKSAVSRALSQSLTGDDA